VLKLDTEDDGIMGEEGHAVKYLAEALCYKPEGRGFESR
jgi:hypothetical protein